MTKQDFDEIFECQIFRFRSGAFAVPMVNFFLPPLWAISSIARGVNFNAWNWAAGFHVTLNGMTIYSHSASWGLMLAFFLCGGATLFSLGGSRFSTLIAAALGAAAFLFAQGSFSEAEAIARAQSVPRMLEIVIGSARLWILLPLAIGVLVCGYAALAGNKAALFGRRVGGED